MTVLTPTIVDGIQIYKLPLTTACTGETTVRSITDIEGNYSNGGIPEGIPHPDSAAER